MPDPLTMFGLLFFGLIGFAAFLYGKKSSRWKTMAIGVVLMVYPYFVPQTWLLYSIGSALCIGLFVFRD
jgi:hypothetical protein